MTEQARYTLFAGTERIAQGDRSRIAVAAKSLIEARDPRPVLAFADATGDQVDFDLRGSLEDVTKRYEAETPDMPEAEPSRRGPGRPKLGVIGREVTLLPRHWEWLNAQPGGASITLRKLVERARGGDRTGDRVRLSREATYRFISALAGDAPGYEEACRALFAGDRAKYEACTQDWAADVRDYAGALAAAAFDAA